MATKVTTLTEFYELYKNEVLAQASEISDFSEGSMHDILAGALSAGLNEISELIITEFSKTFFDLASGADLDKLAVDHFGDKFARPVASQATGEITFTRPNTDSGDVTINQGTVVKTAKDANGEEVRFVTTETVSMTGLSITAQIRAVLGGTSGNAGAGKIVVLESTLSDPNVTVSNASNMAGGTNAPEDADYREIIKSLIRALAGATEAAVVGAALATPGVSMAKAITAERIVIDYDISTDDIASGAEFFRIPYVRLYIADALGNSSQALVEAVKNSIFGVKAAGVRIEVLGAVAVALNWTASITLNSGGPNYSELQSDTTKIVDTMKDYVDKVLTIGQDFSKANAASYVMSIWGPMGTNDLVSFSSSVPSGNVSVNANEKLISGVVQIV
jgi:autotransporter-associated beta strand protein